MRFDDLFDLQRGPEALVRSAFYPLVLLLVCSLVLGLLAKLPPEAMLGLLCMLLFLSPAAYFIRKSRQGHSGDRGARRGAERTPLLPRNEEDL
jgi:uncharacterized membrane protein YfcA